jgi:hypothetical protein
LAAVAATAERRKQATAFERAAGGCRVMQI